MTCQEVIAVLADYLDGSIPPCLLEEVERHLELCAPCRAYLATYTRTQTISAEAARIEMPDDMKARLERFLLQHLRRA